MLSIHTAKSLIPSSRVGLLSIVACRAAAARKREYRGTCALNNGNGEKGEDKAEPTAMKSAEELLGELATANEQLKSCQETLAQEKAKADDFKACPPSLYFRCMM